MTTTNRIFAVALLFTSACDDVTSEDPLDTHHHGLTTTLVLYFTPTGGGETLSFTWADPEDDGNPIIDDIFLPDGSDHNHHDAMSYTLDVEVWNELEDPITDVTPEIESLDTEHQVFFTGSAVMGPATGANTDAIIEQAYADSDANGLPLGLTNTITTRDWGDGELTVTLRHLPPENGQDVKTEGLANDVALTGFGSIGGDNDIQATFPIEVE
ncbi:MAG: hypothetical protein AAFV53_03050 [Myxococcota bacterium]